MPTHPGHPAIASTTLVSASRSLLNDAFDSVSIQTLTASATVDPDLGRYILVAPADHMTITLPDPSSDERYQNVRLVLKRTTAGTGAVSVVVAGGGTIDGASSTTLNAQYDCEVLMSDTTAGVWHRLRDASNLLAPDYLDFGDWIVGTDDSNPAPTATSDQYVAPDGTTTADKIEWDNSTELADESWAEPGAASIEAGDTAQYSFYIDSEVGDGVKTVLEVGDSSAPQITEQATVAFSNVFAEDRYASYAPGSNPAGYYASVENWDRVGNWTVAASSSSTPSDISGAFDFESIDPFTGGKRIVGDIGTEPFIPGQEVTVALWIYKPSFASNAGFVTWWFSLRDSFGADVERILAYINTSGELQSITATTSGPGYTAANAVRLQDHPTDSNWTKLSIRLRDYGGTAVRTQVLFGYNAATGFEFTIAQPSFYLGNHITGQQLLTVDDGVENLLKEGSTDYSDFSTWANFTATPSSIAAPDGTLTAYDLTGATGQDLYIHTVLSYADNSDFTISVDVYQPTLTDVFTVEVVQYGTVFERRRVAFNTSVEITSVLLETGGPVLAVERVCYVEPIGATGWHRIYISSNNFDNNAFMVVRYLTAANASATYTLWNPTLRYGDWVSRGKNRVTSGEDLLDPDWTHTNATVTRSDEVTPAGTSSAVLVVPDAGSRALNLDGPKQLWETVDPATDACRVTISGYYKDAGAGYAAMGISNSAGYTATATFDLATGATTTGSHPTPASDLVAAYEVVSNGWRKCSFSCTLPTGAVYLRNVHFTCSTVPGYSPYGRTITNDGTNGVHIWGARVTIGNPADARGYFVSGPQNLLGDGSDYSGWTAGTN